MHTTTPKPMLNRALRLLRAYHHLTQAQVAKRAGLSKSYVSELESGRKKVGIDVLEIYSSVFKIPVSSLMLFAEHTEDGFRTEDLKFYVADKTLKMLEWISTISRENQAESDSHDD
jgi:transcriptional regulator with XRE-family HTH domain